MFIEFNTCILRDLNFFFCFIYLCDSIFFFIIETHFSAPNVFRFLYVLCYGSVDRRLNFNCVVKFPFIFDKTARKKKFEIPSKTVMISVFPGIVFQRFEKTTSAKYNIILLETFCFRVYTFIGALWKIGTVNVDDESSKAGIIIKTPFRNNVARTSGRVTFTLATEYNKFTSNTRV